MLRDKLLLDVNLSFEDKEFLLEIRAALLTIHELEDCLELVTELFDMQVRAHQLQVNILGKLHDAYRDLMS